MLYTRIHRILYTILIFNINELINILMFLKKKKKLIKEQNVSI